MDINRNNYESFFLLYVDGELGVADKKAVEAFVRQNPDLQEELNMFQQTLLQPEAYVFANKKSLHKHTEATQEQLLLYLHNELAPAEAKAIQQQLATNGALQKEWAILQQTVLPADEDIQFANKEILYRREPARVIAAKWWRIAAAALLLGFGVWGGVALMNKNDHGNTHAIGGEVATTNDTDNQHGLNNNTSNTVNNNNSEVAVNNSDSPVAAPVAEAPLNNNMAVVAHDKIVPKKETVPTRWSPEAAVVSGQNDLDRMKKEAQKTLLENFNTNNGNEIASNNVTPKNKELEPAISTPIERINPENAKSAEVLKNNAAAYAVNDMKAVGATDSYLATSNKKVRRSGLLRKVTRFFQRSINNRGDGDGLKIAGFEFAVK